jgi:hypothetical protein
MGYSYVSATRTSIPTKTDTAVLQSIYVLYKIMNQWSLSRLNPYQPKFGLAETLTLEFLAFGEPS